MRALLVAAGLCVLILLLLPACGSERGAAWNPAPHARVDALLQETAHDDPIVRRDAIAALGKIWSAGARSVPVLTAALDDDDERVR